MKSSGETIREFETQVKNSSKQVEALKNNIHEVETNLSDSRQKHEVVLKQKDMETADLSRKIEELETVIRYHSKQALREKENRDHQSSELVSTLEQQVPS